MGHKILLLEDDDSIRSFVKINLKRNNFEVIEAASGEEALKKFEEEEGIDIGIFDVMLPGISGFEVCKTVREKNSRMGIIMLTAKSQDMDKVMGLDLGADDYMTKPFSPVELVARVNALVRRIDAGKDENSHIIKSGMFTMDLEAMKFFKGEEEIDLTPTEFSIMKLFLRNPNRALKRDDLLNEVWGHNYIGELKIVDVNIRRLRRKVEEDASSPVYIETIWGCGYRWREDE